jgi:ABC-type lipoprotein export system ATPase subunit
VSALVEVQDVFHVYPSPDGGVAALQGLTLTIHEGETCVVLGPSGSGKSTLLRIVAGFDRPSAGIVRVAGVDVATLPAHRRARYRSQLLGYADQHYWRALAGELSVHELVGVQLGLAGASAAARDRRAAELLERVGLGDRRDAHPRELSGGEQQRVALCAAIAHRPRLLIADEPTGELDAANGRDVFALIAELVRESKGTALVVSHDPTSAEYADRVAHVRDGRVSAEGRAGDDGAGSVVVGRGGWLRLPEDLLSSAGIVDRATVGLRDRELVVTAPDDAGPSVPGTQSQPPTPSRVEPSSACVPGTQAPAGQALVEARGLRRGFGDLTPIDGLDASFGAGRVAVVTGPSGSGKTTLLHLLAGLDTPDAGTVVVDGVDLASLDRTGRAELRRTRLAFIGQAPGLVPFLGARENVALGLALRGFAAGERDRLASEAIADLGLEDHAERPVEQLSAGQRVRASVARAFAARPLVVVADEPTARLDAANALALGTLFVELARTIGIAFICATHDPLLIEQADQELSLGSS